jgi:hypothetical protein
LHTHTVLLESGEEPVRQVKHALLSEFEIEFEGHAVQTGAVAVPVFLYPKEHVGFTTPPGTA